MEARSSRWNIYLHTVKVKIACTQIFFLCFLLKKTPLPNLNLSSILMRKGSGCSWPCFPSLREVLAKMCLLWVDAWLSVREEATFSPQPSPLEPSCGTILCHRPEFSEYRTGRTRSFHKILVKRFRRPEKVVQLK